MATIAEALQIATQHFQAGELREVESICQQILQHAPQHAGVLHLLGLVAHREGKNDAACEYIEKAIAVNPQVPPFYYNLGLALLELGKPEEAIREFRKALRLAPNFAEAYNGLGNALVKTEDLAAAVENYQQAIRIKPGYAEAHHNLGIVFQKQGQLDAAIESLKRAIEVKLDYDQAYSSLGNALTKKGELGAAIECYQKAIEINPNFAGAYNDLGTALNSFGKIDLAIETFQKAVRINPSSREAYVNLGTAFSKNGQTEPAIENFRHAIRVDPNYAEAYNNLAIVLDKQAQPDAAIKNLQHALQINPNYAEAHNNLANLLKDRNQIEQALEHYQQALRINPKQSTTHSNLLLMYSYLALLSPEQTLEEHREWDRRHGGIDRINTFSHQRKRDPDKRLRIGYISPDFKWHVISFFFEPILESHDKSKVEIFCYAQVNKPDQVTERLQSLSDGWRYTVGLSDKAVAQAINEDGIDILVDLAGHTTGNRLEVFTYKPAPIQITYLGYFTTTGLAAMDYWIADTMVTPKDTVEKTAEKIYRLPRCWVCYKPQADCPNVRERPVGMNVTFGCFNSMTKVSRASIEVWSRILQSVPNSRLLLKSRQLADPYMREYFTEMFGRYKITEDRILLLPRTSTIYKHQEKYGDVDIALDPFPCAGGTTTAEALWMGVPVITLAGSRFAGRMGASILAAAGMTEFIASSPEEYVNIAIGLAEDGERRAKLRMSQRSKIANSPLCDGPGLATALEDAYREMWCSYLQDKT